MQHCELLSSASAALSGDLNGADFSVPVATCPGWDLKQLVLHMGTSQRWVAAMIRDGRGEPLKPADLDSELPASDEDLGRWYAGSARALLAALSETKPDAYAWSWRTDQQRVSFWARRMLFETVVHGADARLVLGMQPAVEAGVAADGIDELLESLPYLRAVRPAIADLRGQGESLHFHCTDAEGEWMVRLEPAGLAWEHGHGKGDVAVRGAAGDLLLLLYGRYDPSDSRFQCFGDRALLQRWLEHSKV